MKRLSRYLILLLALLSVATSVAALPIGTPAPDFELSNLDGKVFSLGEVPGALILLKLGASWCPGCRQQSLELQGVEKELQQRHVSLVDVFLQDTADDVRTYYRSFGKPVPELALLGNSQVRDSYQVYAIPRLLLINGSGQVVFDRGFVGHAEILELLDEALDD